MERTVEYPWHVGSWGQVAELGADLDHDTFLVIRRWALGDPQAAGFYWLPGYPKGTLRQWRFRLPDDSGVHVYLYDDRVVVHRDRVDPSASLAGHLVADCPGLVMTGLGLGVVSMLAAASRE